MCRTQPLSADNLFGEFNYFLCISPLLLLLLTSLIDAHAVLRLLPPRYNGTKENVNIFVHTANLPLFVH